MTKSTWSWCNSFHKCSILVELEFNKWNLCWHVFGSWSSYHMIHNNALVNRSPPMLLNICTLLQSSITQLTIIVITRCHVPPCRQVLLQLQAIKLCCFYYSLSITQPQEVEWMDGAHKWHLVLECLPLFPKLQSLKKKNLGFLF